MDDILILSIYDGGYKASLAYDNSVYDLTRLAEMDLNHRNENILSYLYNDLIKDNKWYNNKKAVLNYIFNMFDINNIIVCEDGNIEIHKRSDK